MIVKITKKLANVNYEFQIEAQKGKDALVMASMVGDMPEKCGLEDCGSENVHLSMNKAKAKDGSGEYVYVKVICKECNGRAPLGEFKSGGFFWKSWEKYVPPAQKKEEQTKQSGEEVNVEEIPF